MNEDLKRIPTGNLLRNMNMIVDEEHNYSLGGNINNAFGLGYMGSQDNFYLIGCRPDPASPHSPLLTGRILDSEGNLLFQLVRNQLVINPGDCSLITGGFWGFEVVDSAGHRIMRVTTSFDEDGVAVTSIVGDFFDRFGKLVVATIDVEGANHVVIASELPSVLGFSNAGGVGMSAGLDDMGLEVMRAAVHSGGAIYLLTTGDYIGQVIMLDGRYIRDARFQQCVLRSSTGNFQLAGSISFEGCGFEFEGPAGAVYNVVVGMLKSSGSNKLH